VHVDDAEACLPSRGGGLCPAAASGAPDPGIRTAQRDNRGIARIALTRDEAAYRDLMVAVEAKEAREWVRGRSHLELGKLLERRNQPAEARWQYEKAAAALERGQDEGPLAEARALLRAIKRK